jgi:hypothetical protein
MHSIPCVARHIVDKESEPRGRISGRMWGGSQKQFFLWINGWLLKRVWNTEKPLPFLIPLPLKRVVRGSSLENFEFLHCCRCAFGWFPQKELWLLADWSTYVLILLQSCSSWPFRLPMYDPSFPTSSLLEFPPTPPHEAECFPRSGPPLKILKIYIAVREFKEDFEGNRKVSYTFSPIVELVRKVLLKYPCYECHYKYSD